MKTASMQGAVVVSGMDRVLLLWFDSSTVLGVCYSKAEGGPKSYSGSYSVEGRAKKMCL